MTTAAQQILKAYKLAQIIDPREEIQGYMQKEGLIIMNDIIAQWTSLQPYIPTYKILTIDIEEGLYEYEIIPALTNILDGNIRDTSNVQYLLYNVDLKTFNTFNFTNVASPGIPTQVFLQNDFDNFSTQSKLIFYPVPCADFTATIYAKANLPALTYSETIQNMPTFYLKCLNYEMAFQLSEEYNTILNDKFMITYNRLMKELKAANKKDMSVKNHNPFFSGRFRPWGARGG